MNIKIKWLNDFIEENKWLIKIKRNEIKHKIENTWKWENLWDDFNKKNVQDWIIWELLFAKTQKGKFALDPLWEWDIELWNNKIDVKTLRTKKDLNKPEWLSYLSLYLQKKQVKREVNYCPVLLNYEADNALIIIDYFHLSWSYIIDNIKPLFKNPPFTKTKKLIENFIIPYNTFL